MPNPGIRQLEEAMANMLPSEESVLHDGWLLRFNPGRSRNPNSVWTLDEGQSPVESRIDWCERQYRERGLTCSFRLSEGDEQRDLEARLIDRGYVVHNPNRLLTNGAIPESETELTQITLEDWLTTLGDLDPETSSSDIEMKRGPLSRITLPAWYARVDHDGEPCSLGRAVQQGELLQLAELWTRPDLRGKGYGTQLILGLMGVGRQAGARTAFMPVSESNEGAWGLYDRLGFRSVYGFRYLVPAG